LVSGFIEMLRIDTLEGKLRTFIPNWLRTTR
jgi:hypothetical protein